MESEEDLMTLLKNIAAAKYPEIITFLLKLRGDMAFNLPQSLIKITHAFKFSQTKI